MFRISWRYLGEKDMKEGYKKMTREEEREFEELAKRIRKAVKKWRKKKNI